MTAEQLSPRLPDDADPKQIHERKRERADAFNLNNRIKGLMKVMAFRLSLLARQAKVWIIDLERSVNNARTFGSRSKVTHSGAQTHAPVDITPRLQHLAEPAY